MPLGTLWLWFIIRKVKLICGLIMMKPLFIHMIAIIEQIEEAGIYVNLINTEL